MTIPIAQMKSAQIIGWSSASDGSAPADSTVVRNSTPGLTVNVPVTFPAGQIDLLLPTQTSQSGKFLTTNGTASSWATVTAGVQLNNSSPWTVGQPTVVTDTATATTPTLLSLDHESSNAAAANFGGQILLIGKDSTTATQSMGALVFQWKDPAHASATSQVFLQTVGNAGGLSNSLVVGSGLGVSGSGVIVGAYNGFNGGIWYGGIDPSSANAAMILGNTGNNYVNADSGQSLFLAIAATPQLTITSGLLTFKDACNVAFDTTTGTKIGTATGQKIAFWNSTPVVQQVLATGASHTVDNVITFLQTIGLCKQS